MKRMLINATQSEELRMAIVDGQRLYDLNIEAPASERKKANIYKGKITRIEPSLEAAFVEYGSDRHGFLPLKEISSEYFVKDANTTGKINIKDVLREGQDIVVQVDKEERGNKGAALTTFVSLAGRFIVLKPNKGRSGGVSRRITGDDRDHARKALKDIEIPEGMSVILRTAGIDRSTEELAWDLQNLLTVWTAILNVVLERKSPFLLYRESDSVVRALRDYLTNDIGEILIDDEATYKEALEHVEMTMPHNLRKLKHYTDPVPLFTRYQIESQIESAFAHNVNLPSGGSIVIDHTEALVSIDINSARATKGGDIEATALNTNLEAADEVARQMRIRDLGGLVVIDFIDMGPQKHQRDVENRLRDAVKQDRARIQIGKISRFGLLEMSRQRLRPSIGESSYKTCPRCTGFGTIRGTESLALAILRIVGEEARKERTGKVIAQLPVEVATYLLNEKRDWVQSLEDQTETQVVLIANPNLETPHYDVRRVRDDQMDLPENTGASFALAAAPAEPESPQAILERKGVETAAVGTLKPSTPAPKRPPPPKEPRKGLLTRIAEFFTGDEDEKAAKKKKADQRGGKGKAAKSTRGKKPQQQSRRRGSDSRQASDKPGSGRKRTKKKAPAKQRAKQQPQQDDDQQSGAEQKPAEAKGGDSADASNTEQKRTRSRRSRGGRRRRRSSGDKPEQATDQTQNADQAQTAENTGEKTTGGDQEQKAQSERPKKASRPRTRKPKADKAESGGDTAQAPEQSGSADKPRADGPPKARTDAERAQDSKSSDETPARKAVAVADEKRAVQAKPAEAPKPKAEEPKPAEAPQQPKAAEPKPAEAPKPKAEEQKPAEASKPKAEEQKPAEASKPKAEEQKPAEASKPKAEEQKPAEASKPAGGRLLPWDSENSDSTP